MQLKIELYNNEYGNTNEMEMYDDYGQFVELDYDNDLQTIDTFKIKLKHINSNYSKNYSKHDSQKYSAYVYLLSLCVCICLKF